MLPLRLTLAALALSLGATAQIGWTAVPTTTNPGLRAAHGLVADAARNHLVLFGGRSGSSVLGDTWTWNGSTWTQVATSGPSPRHGHAMVYDALRQVVVVFGGYDPLGTVLADTWEWNGASWTQRLTATTPPARAFAASAAWPAWGGIVVNGGVPVDSTPHFWSFDGVDWTDRTTAATPRSYNHAMAYHPLQQRLVLVGRDPYPGFQYNFLFDGTSWTQNDTSFFAEAGTRLVYDPLRRRILAHGGYVFSGSYWTYQTQTWAWDGVWSRIDTDTQPSDRNDFGLALDPANGQLLVHGGTNLNLPVAGDFDDLWTLPFTAAQPYTEPRVTAFGLDRTCLHIGVWPFSPTDKPLLSTGGQRPWIGEGVSLYLQRLGWSFAVTPTLLVYGLSNSTWNGGNLPLPLTMLGRPDCQLLVAPDVTLMASVAQGMVWNLQIPNVPALVGTTHWFQVLGLANPSPAANPLFTSNGLELQIGRR